MIYCGQLRYTWMQTNKRWNYCQLIPFSNKCCSTPAIASGVCVCVWLRERPGASLPSNIMLSLLAEAGSCHSTFTVPLSRSPADNRRKEKESAEWEESRPRIITAQCSGIANYTMLCTYVGSKPFSRTERQLETMGWSKERNKCPSLAIHIREHNERP